MSTVTPIPTGRQRITRISTPTDMRMAILMGKPAGMTMNTRVATALTLTNISIASPLRRAADVGKVELASPPTQI